ncbi:gliding motility-associated C-terminal domain-containing protein [Flagellimonas marinaquae]
MSTILTKTSKQQPTALVRSGLLLFFFLVLGMGTGFGQNFIIVEEGGVTATSETGTTDTFTVVLDTQPATDVVFDVVSGDTNEGTVDLATLTFTNGNWDTPQTVTVTGVDDAVVDGTQTYDITISVDAAASDNAFDGLAPQTVSVDNADDDIAGFTIVEEGGVTATSETGTTDTFTVVLDTQPATDVVFDVVSGDTNEGTVDLATLTFTNGNWDTPQTVTVTGVDDAVVDGTQTYDITISVDAAASDNAFDGLAPQTVSVDNADDDIPTATIIASDDTATEQGDTPGAFTVNLSDINNTGSDIIIAYSVSGSATPVDDYDALSGTVAIQTGQTNATIIVDPNDDNLTELTETVIVTLDTGTGYIVGGSNSATVNIISEDDVQPSGYTVTIDQDPIDSSNQDEVSFTFSGAPTFLTSYDYTFTSDADGNVASVTGGGLVLSSDQTVSGIDLSSLQDGLITLTVTVSNVLGTEGPETSDTAVKLTSIPSGYTVSFDQDPINQTNENNISFTFSNAEVNASYNYTISSSGGGTNVVGNGPITSLDQQISGIDLSGLGNGTISLSVVLSNTNGAGAPATATSTKETCFAGTTAPIFNGAGTAFCDAFNQDLDLYISNAAPAGAELRWSTNANIAAGGYLVSSVVSTPDTYYGFFYDPINDCFTNATQVVLTQSTTPTTGTATNLGTCSDAGDGDTLVDLDSSLSGADDGDWVLLSAQPGATITINTENIINFDGQPEGVYTFRYTTNTAQGECTNQSVDITVTVNDCSGPCDAGNTAPALNGGSSTIAFCDAITANLNDYVTSTPPAGTTLVWSTSNDPEETGAHLQAPNVVEPGTYYAFYYDDVNDCGSPVLAITLELNNTPVIDSTTGDVSCGPSILDLTASASVAGNGTIAYTWYDAPTGGNIVGTSATFTTNTLSETTSYYVSASANGCESDRVEVEATIINALSPGIPIEDLTVCSIPSDDGPTTFDLDDGLMGQDAGTWSVVTDPSGNVTIGTDNIVDFTGLTLGAYVFEYTTETVGECVETSSVQLTITVLDCVSNETIDLAITKEVNDESVLLNTEVSFTITVENLTTGTAQNIVVSDLLSDGFEFLSSDPSKGSYDDTTGEWTIDELVGEENATLIIRTKVTEAGTLTNTATLSSSLPIDDNPENDTASVEVKVNRSQCEDPGTLCNIFSPNGDGDNETLTLVDHTSYQSNKLEIFDRYGNSVFQMDGYDSSWDGTGKNGDLPNGTYYYILDLNGDGTEVVKGWIQIVR